jgi:hypothetical protein
VSEESIKVASLVEKLAGWVAQQPEYPYLFLADRGRRKRAARIVANRLLLIPSITPDPGTVDRETFRKQQRAVNGFVGGMKTKMSKSEQRMLAQAEKSRRRYQSLSVERAHELALREDQERTAQRLAIEAMEAELAKAAEQQPEVDLSQAVVLGEGEQDGVDTQAQDELDGAQDA